MINGYTTSESITIFLGLALIAVSVIRCVVKICIINHKHKIWMRKFEERHSIGGKANDKS